MRSFPKSEPGRLIRPSLRRPSRLPVRGAPRHRLCQRSNDFSRVGGSVSAEVRAAAVWWFSVLERRGGRAAAFWKGTSHAPAARALRGRHCRRGCLDHHQRRTSPSALAHVKQHLQLPAQETPLSNLPSDSRPPSPPRGAKTPHRDRTGECARGGRACACVVSIIPPSRANSPRRRP